MDDLDRLQIQRREVSDNIRRVAKEIIMMEEVLKETEDNLLAFEFAMVAKDSVKWIEKAEKSAKFRERISHLKSEHRRFLRMEEVYVGQIVELARRKRQEEEDLAELEKIENKKLKMAEEIESLKNERKDTKNILEELNRQKGERESQIKQAALKLESDDEAVVETVKEDSIMSSDFHIRSIKDLAAMYNEIGKKEKERQESEVEIEFAPPKSLKELKFSVNEFNVSDLKEIIDIETFSFPRPWRRYMFYKEMDIPVSHHFVLRAQNDEIKFVMAYCVFWASNKKMSIKNFAIHPSYRMQGIGEKFLNINLNKAKLLGMGQAEIIVRESNRASLQLLKKLNFKQIDIRHNYFGFKKEAAVIMERKL